MAMANNSTSTALREMERGTIVIVKLLMDFSE